MKKPPVIRRGQCKPYVKCTKEQYEERIEFVAGLYAERPLIRRMEIHKTVAGKFNVSWRQCDIYIAHAMKLNRKRSEMPQEQVKSIVVNALLSVIGTGKNVVQATTTLCDIYGLFAPKKTELSGPDGGNIEMDFSIDSLKLPVNTRKQILDAIRKRKEMHPIESSRNERHNGG